MTSGGGRSAEWTRLRRAGTDFGKQGGPDLAGRVLARLIQALGGATAATAAAVAGAGVPSAQRIGVVGSGLAGPGLTPTLESLGLRRLVGGSRFDVVEGLVDEIAGSGDALEEQAARTAALDVLNEVFGDAETYEQLEETTVDQDGVLAILESFAAAYIYARLAPALDERLNKLGDPKLVRRREREMREYTRATVQLELEGVDASQLDWSGSQGKQLLESSIRAVFEQLEALDS